MLEIFKDALAHQYEAALCTLNACIDGCPETAWNAPIANLAFCQVAFHALFFTDLYLGPMWNRFASSRSIATTPTPFAITRSLRIASNNCSTTSHFIKAYLDHCRSKALRKSSPPKRASRLQAPRVRFVEVHSRRIARLQHSPHPAPRRPVELAAKTRLGPRYALVRLRLARYIDEGSIARDTAATSSIKASTASRGTGPISAARSAV